MPSDINRLLCYSWALACHRRIRDCEHRGNMLDHFAGGLCPPGPPETCLPEGNFDERTCRRPTGTAVFASGGGDHLSPLCSSTRADCRQFVPALSATCRLSARPAASWHVLPPVGTSSIAGTSGRQSARRVDSGHFVPTVGKPCRQSASRSMCY